MTLQSGIYLCPDLATDAKWCMVDLRNLFDNGGLSNLWNDLMRSGELVSPDQDFTGIALKKFQFPLKLIPFPNSYRRR